MVIGQAGQMVARIAREAGDDLSTVFLREVKLRLSVKVKNWRGLWETEYCDHLGQTQYYGGLVCWKLTLLDSTDSLDTILSERSDWFLLLDCGQTYSWTVLLRACECSSWVSYWELMETQSDSSLPLNLFSAFSTVTSLKGHHTVFLHKHCSWVKDDLCKFLHIFSTGLSFRASVT